MYANFNEYLENELTVIIGLSLASPQHDNRATAKEWANFLAKRTIRLPLSSMKNILMQIIQNK